MARRRPPPTRGGPAQPGPLRTPGLPCTRASLEELAAILGRTRGAVAAHVLFFRPAGFPDSWRPTDLRSRAEAMPGVRVLDDPDGPEAARFGAETSGHLALYDRSGALLYAGGITGARGRVGDNPGSDGVIRLLAGSSPGSDGDPVYGCPLFEDPPRSGERP